MEHWQLTRDEDGLAWLAIDRAGTTTNTLSRAVIAEFNGALDQLHADPPKGLVIRSGKPSGFSPKLVAKGSRVGRNPPTCTTDVFLLLIVNRIIVAR